MTLILESGRQAEVRIAPCKRRPLRGADNGQLLDGQQRMTAVWRVLNDNYEDGSYFVVVEDFDSEEPQMAAEVIRQSRWRKKDNRRYPLWCDKPKECLARKMIPASLLCPTKSLGSCNYDKWIREALGNKEGYSSADEYYELKESVKSTVDKLREHRELQSALSGAALVDQRGRRARRVR